MRYYLEQNVAHDRCYAIRGEQIMAIVDGQKLVHVATVGRQQKTGRNLPDLPRVDIWNIALRPHQGLRSPGNFCNSDKIVHIGRTDIKVRDRESACVQHLTRDEMLCRSAASEVTQPLRNSVDLLFRLVPD